VLPEVPQQQLPEYEESKSLAAVEADPRYSEVAPDLARTSKAKRVARNASKRASTLNNESNLTDGENPRRSRRLESRHKALKQQLSYVDGDDELNNAQPE